MLRCPECGNGFEPKYENQRFCSRKHQERFNSREKKRRKRQRRRGEIAPETPPEPPPDRFPDARGMALYDALVALQEAAEPMPPVERVFAFPDDKPQGIAHFADLHFGARGTDHRRLRDDMLAVAQTDGMWALAGGDYVQNWIHGKGFTDSLISPREQWALAATFFQTLEAKLVAVLKGNHDRFTDARADVDFLAELLRRLSLYMVYHGNAAFIEYAFPNGTVYAEMAVHKAPGRSVFNPLHGAQRLYRERRDADVYFAADSHTPGQGGQHTERGWKVFVQAGTYQVDSAWADDRGFPQTAAISAPVVILFPDGRTPIVCQDLETGVHTLKLWRAHWPEE